ncbi:MATE family efflux transporter [Anaeromicropila populeti]|uniref:Putative efflux protein, MATE family n=1 Tax=Anaeromicropila populeti TaxID=37658 RepID=A0A1I6IE67_9FIRM|nr:MATE family efflux transporter [Anaeromicropila populeti]SFR64919.1 putative efflux protein, MATE family [Anaeromicropila populeti]
MANNNVYDMTKGKEFPLLMKFAYPMLIGNVFQQLYNMADSIIVGKFVGTDALAAVGASGSLHFFFFSLCMGMATGVGILISQYFGAKQEKEIRKAIANSIYLILAAGLLMSSLSVLFSRNILVALNTPDNILKDALIYMRIVCGGILAVASYNAVSAILRALGDSRTPLMFLVFASLVNILLDLLFVCVLHWGVAGAGIATVMSQALAAITCIIYAVYKNPYFKISKRDMKFEKNIILKSIKIGIPVAAQSAFISISCVVLQRVVNTFGDDVMAAYTATLRIEQLIQQPFNSLCAAVSTFSGQNIGAKKVDRVCKGFHKSVIIVIVFSFAMLVVMQFTSSGIMRLFVDKEKVIDFGSTALKITSCFYFPLGMIYVARGLLNGVGDASYAMMVGLVEVFGRVVFSTVLVSIPVIGVWGIWYTSGLTWLITGLFSFIRYKQGKWKELSLIYS